MSCGDSHSYALQSRLNAPYAAASDGTKQLRLLLDNRVDFIQRELSVLGRWRGGLGVGGQLEGAWGGATDMYVRSGVTSFNSCPNPELETISLLQWHRIRLDLTRSYSHLQQGRLFPMLPSNQAISHSQENYSPVVAKMFTPPYCIQPILHDMSDKRAYLRTRSS